MRVEEYFQESKILLSWSGKTSDDEFNFGYLIVSIYRMADGDSFAINTSIILQFSVWDCSRTIPINGFIELDLDTNGCKGTPSEVNFLEHVEAVVTLSTSSRGQIQLYLTSPFGTRSILLNRRNHDSSSDGFNAWPFMTTHNWGESPRGHWLLEARNGESVGKIPFHFPPHLVVRVFKLPPNWHSVAEHLFCYFI